jgi:hypothetical protein
MGKLPLPAYEAGLLWCEARSSTSAAEAPPTAPAAAPAAPTPLKPALVRDLSEEEEEAEEESPDELVEAPDGDLGRGGCW